MMKTREQLNADILEMTIKIEKAYPDLSKYIEEMQILIDDLSKPRKTFRNLMDCNNSLDALLKKYTAVHSSSVR